jgi:hypothetical protein
VNEFSNEEYLHTLAVTLHQKALLVRYALINNTDEEISVAFKVRMNRAAQSTQVHGNRKWKEPALHRESKGLLFCATNQIAVREWVEKKGDYLVNEEWQQKIFKKGTPPDQPKEHIEYYQTNDAL